MQGVQRPGKPEEPGNVREVRNGYKKSEKVREFFQTIELHTTYLIVFSQLRMPGFRPNSSEIQIIGLERARKSQGIFWVKEAGHLVYGTDIS